MFVSAWVKSRDSRVNSQQLISTDVSRAPLQRMCSYHFTVSVCIDRVFLLYTDGVYSAAFALNCPYSSLLLGLCILEMFSDTKTIFWSDLTSWIQSKAAIKLSDISRLLFFLQKIKLTQIIVTKKDSASFLHFIRIFHSCNLNFWRIIPQADSIISITWIPRISAFGRSENLSLVKDFFSPNFLIELTIWKFWNTRIIFCSSFSSWIQSKVNFI